MDRVKLNVRQFDWTPKPGTWVGTAEASSLGFVAGVTWPEVLEVEGDQETVDFVKSSRLEHEGEFTGYTYTGSASGGRVMTVNVYND